MEKLKRKIEQAEKALKTLEEILKEPYSKIVRDATIQRFEYTFEVIWKALKEYLYYQEGITSNSPKSCFREASNVGLMDEEQTLQCLEMTDDRNLTSHTYWEEIAEGLYRKMMSYFNIMQYLVNTIKKKVAL